MEILYCNLNKGTVSGAREGSAYTFRPAVAGEVRRFALRFVEEINGITVDADPDIVSIQLCLGKIDARPTGGKISYQFGEGASTADNTTAELPYNHNAAALKAAIPAAVIAAHGQPVAQDVPGGVTLTFAAQVPISPRNNTLWPLSFLRAHAWEVPDGGWLHDLRMVQAPLVQTTEWLRVLPPAPSLETIRDGGADPSGTYLWSEIQEVTVPTAFRGTFHFRNPETLARSVVLSPDDDAESLQKALAAIYPDGDVTVTNPADQKARVEWSGGYIGEDMPPVEIFVDDAPPGDPTLEMDFRLASIYAALREEAAFYGYIEARAIIARDGVPQGEPAVLFRAEMQVVRDQNWDGMSTQVTPAWLRPPNPVDYVPYDESQVMVGSRHYGALIGDGAATEIVIDHNLDSEDIAAITVRETLSPADIVTGWTAELNGKNALTLHFAEAPAPNSLVVVITAAGQVSAFQAHVHTQSQVDGLQEALEDLFLRVATLEALLPRAGAAGLMSGLNNQAFELPDIGEILADAAVLGAEATLASQIVVAPQKQDAPEGTDIKKEEDKKAEEEAAKEKDPDAIPANILYRAAIPGVGATGTKGQSEQKGATGDIIVPEVPETPAAPAVWPARKNAAKWPYLLGAITDESPTSAATLPAEPLAGTVFQNTSGAAMALPGGNGRKAQSVPDDGFFAYDGRAFYRVAADGGDDYFALEMERELWRVLLGSEQFPEGAALEIGGEIRSRLIGEPFDDDARDVPRLDYGAQYILRCEAVPVAGGGSLGAASAPVVLGETPVRLSPNLETFRWSLKAKRDASGIASAWVAYGKAAAGATFALPAAIRLRLVNFDCDDASADPRGQVALIMPATKLEVTL